MERKNSETIHRQTMVMNCLMAVFFTIYGLALGDAIVVIPNATGLGLGLAQGILCLLYPKTSRTLDLESVDNDPLLSETYEESQV